MVPRPQPLRRSQTTAGQALTGSARAWRWVVWAAAREASVLASRSSHDQSQAEGDLEGSRGLGVGRSRHQANGAWGCSGKTLVSRS